jgi:heat shock protein HtpX
MRIQILRAMAGRAGYLDYESAYKKVRGEKEACLGARTLGEGDSVQARAAAPEPEPKQAAIDRARDVAGLLGRMGQYLEIPCACGLTIKVPPEFKPSEVVCPRCGTRHEVPSAKPVEASGAGAAGRAAPEQTYQRKQAGAWESFRCACGQTVQLSPLFAGTHVVCPACHQTITIVGLHAETVGKEK